MGSTTATVEPPVEKARRIAKRFFRQECAILVIVLVVLIIALSVITKGVTTRPANMGNTLLQSSIRGVATIGQAFVILTAGIDLSVGGIGLFASNLGAAMIAGFEHQNITGGAATVPQAILAMLAVAVAMGMISGFSVSRFYMPALIVTLAMWEAMKGAAFLINKGESIGHLPQVLAFFGSGNVGVVPVPVIFFILTAVGGYFVLNYTGFGRSVYAVGGNPVSAWLSGISVKGILFSVYAISGFLAGLTSVIMTARIMSASMTTLAGLELDTIASCVIGGVSLFGGRGSLIGVVLGVIIIGVVNNGLTVLGADPAVQGIAKASIIYTAVALDFLRRRGR